MSAWHRHMHRRRDGLSDVDSLISGGDGLRRRDSQQLGGGPDSFGKKEAQATVVEVVYKTMPQTFEGPVAGYLTLYQDPHPEPTHNPAPTTPSQEIRGPSKTAEAHASIPTVIRPSDGSQSVSSVLAKATGSPSRSPSPILAIDENRQPSISTSSSVLVSRPIAGASSSDNATGTGTSAGKKAGIAFGVLGGVFLIGLIAFFIFRRRRQQQSRQRLDDDDEKLNGALGRGFQGFTEDVPRSNPRAPRISLRPVTQFLPNWSLDKRASKGPDMAFSGDSVDRSDTSHSNRSANPFGNHAERAPSPIDEEDEASALQSPTSSPRDLTSDKSGDKSLPQGSGVVGEKLSHGSDGAAGADGVAAAGAAGDGAVGSATAAVAAAGSALVRKASMKNRDPGQVDLTMPPVPGGPGANPPSPAGTEFSISSTATGQTPPPTQSSVAIAAAGGPVTSAVHRVQLAFKPSLDDEMELRAGELVRLLHQYDDGWALVIRLDRSEQGVVPRTCLSMHPVKPRPQQGRPPIYASTPSNGRASPSRPRMGPSALPRLTSPAGQPMGQPMSPSTASSSSSPPRSSPLNPGPSSPAGSRTGAIDRKPVPGQAY